MANKNYTEEQERMARFAKAMGHPARMAILEFLLRQETCFFGDIHEELPIAKATVSQHLKELKEARTDTGRDRNSEGEILHQQRELGACGKNVFCVLRSVCLQERELLRISSIFFYFLCS